MAIHLPSTITTYATPNADAVEYIQDRKFQADIRLVEPDPTWPQQFEELERDIRSVIGSDLVTIDHIGPTSVPGLLAKPIIDIDITVKDIQNESTYVDGLEALGFTFRLRQPSWYDLRFFILERPAAPSVNLKVFGCPCPEVERHLIFRNWLRNNSDDKLRYADIKKESLKKSEKLGEGFAGYNRRKEPVLRDIMSNAFKALEWPGLA